MNNLQEANRWPAKICVAALLVACLPPAVLFAGLCCERETADPGCTGCLQIGIDPAKFVHAGDSVTSRCRSTSQPFVCTESNAVCVTLEGATLFGDANCTQIIGTTTVTLYVPMCNDIDDVCNAG